MIKLAKKCFQMDNETIMDQSTPFISLLLKFDGNQQFSKEIQISAYSTLQNHTSNPFSDIPPKKSMYLNRLPPWTDPENLQNLMCRVSGGSTVKVGINSGSCSDIIWALSAIIF